MFLIALIAATMGSVALVALAWATAPKENDAGVDLLIAMCAVGIVLIALTLTFLLR